jgi:hypothetical protein
MPGSFICLDTDSSLWVPMWEYLNSYRQIRHSSLIILSPFLSIFSIFINYPTNELTLSYTWQHRKITHKWLLMRNTFCCRGLHFAFRDALHSGFKIDFVLRTCSSRLYKPLCFIIFKDFSTTSDQREPFVQLPSVWNSVLVRWNLKRGRRNETCDVDFKSYAFP